MPESFEVGQKKTITVTFCNAAGAAADPTGVTLEIRDPSTGTRTTYTHGVDAALVKDTTGVYHFDLTLSAAGDWMFRWAGAGAIVAVDEGVISVRKAAYFP
jgi:hypothetical protein